MLPINLEPIRQLLLPSPDPRPVLLAVAGPTAVGKTALTVALAQEIGTEIISADSRQFYRELSIGTAKPTVAEMRGVVHHFIDSHAIADDYSAGRFAAEAEQRLADLFQRHPVIIATGGSGLYLQALTDGLDELPAVPAAVRQALQAELNDQGLPALLEELRASDPATFARIDRQNPQRVLRALEVGRGTGRPFSSFHRGPAALAEAAAARPFRVVKVALTRSREELYQRIDQRVTAMLAAGLLTEVAALVPHRHQQALQTVGYQEIFGFLGGDYDLAEATRLLQRNTRHYAKRQLTWLRRDPAYSWVSL